MTAAKAVKAAGLKSLTELSELSGVPRNTLDRWFHEKPKLFDLVLKGAVLDQAIKQFK